MMVLTLLLVSGFSGTVAPSAPPTTTPIEHLIIIVQENHTFDNYFGAYPGVNGIQNASCIPYDPANPSLGCLSPYLTHDVMQKGGKHTHRAALGAWDDGKMDGFLVINHDRHPVMAYYDSSTLGYYWTLAGQYSLDDNFFSSVLGYSLPNHWFIVAGASPTAAIDHVNFDRSSVMNQYVKEASTTSTVEELLKGTSVTWKYYNNPLQDSNLSQAIADGSASQFWNPLLSKEETYSNFSSHFVARTKFFTDLTSGNLPAVSFVIPSFPISEHPPANLTVGIQWVKSLINAVSSSSYWNSSAIVLTWDDWGGRYDHVPPPTLAGNRLGFRVPTLVISPYSKQGFIDNTQYSFDSILAFIEHNWGLAPLNLRDAAASPLMNNFDFSQNPRPPPAISFVSQSDQTKVMQYAQQTFEM